MAFSWRVIMKSVLKRAWLLLLVVSFLPLTAQEMRETVYDRYTLLQDSQGASLLGPSGEQLFSQTLDRSREALLRIGDSPLLGGLHMMVVRKEALSLYSLSAVSLQGSVPLLKTAFFPHAPVVFPFRSGWALALLDETAALHIYSLPGGEEITTLGYEEPLLLVNLSETEKDGVLRLRRYLEGRYRRGSLSASDVVSKRAPLWNLPSESLSKSSLKSTSSYRGMDLDFRKFLGFGDSITWGKPTPNDCYIQWLQSRIDEWIGEGTVIKEGVPGESTIMGLERLPTLLLQHRAKYLLFHEGTNDIVNFDIPVETTLANIRAMLETALSLGVQPLMTTLIPRNGWFGQGAFKDRELQICQGLRTMAKELNLPIIDLWKIFWEYPSSSGGYYSLMADVVHPSVKGYHLMGDNWYQTLRALPPEAPVMKLEGFFLSSSGTLGVRISWSAAKEADLKEYRVYWGTSAGEITNLYGPTENLSATLSLSGSSTVYIGVRAVDQDGNVGPLSNTFSYTPRRFPKPY